MIVLLGAKIGPPLPFNETRQIARPVIGAQRFRAGRGTSGIVFVCHADVVHVVGALRLSPCGTSTLHGWQQEPHQDPNDDNGHQQLYDQFRLDEPWNSPHNRALLAQIPSVYQSPQRFGERTNYLVPAGSSTTCARPSPSTLTVSGNLSVFSDNGQPVTLAKNGAGTAVVNNVRVTGSLAVNNTESLADIDYFVVTEPGYLWTCRALILALGRLAARRGLNLCPNYLVTTNALNFIDRSLYAAHEITQMIPIYGLDIYMQIRRQNSWVTYFLPNADGAPPVPASVRWTESTSRLRPIFEAALRTPPGTWFERWEMDRKIHRLSREQGDSSESAFSADVCKGHDMQHQSRTKDLLDSKVSRLMTLMLESPTSAARTPPIA